MFFHNNFSCFTICAPLGGGMEIGMEVGGLGSLYTDYLTSKATDENSLVKGTLKNDYSDASDEELMEACKSFESYFLEQIFDTMLESTKLLSGEKSDSYATKMVDYFKDSAIQSLTEQATNQNGIGLAKTLYEQMKRQYGAVDPKELNE